MLLAAVLSLTLSGCFWGSNDEGGQPPKGDQQRMDSIAAEIQATLAKRPDVEAAEVKYADNLTSSGTAYVNITVKAGTPFAPIIDEAVKLVWLSRLEPLHNLDVGVIDAADRLRGENRYLDPDGKDQAELEGKYGKRPG